MPPHRATAALLSICCMIAASPPLIHPPLACHFLFFRFQRGMPYTASSLLLLSDCCVRDCTYWCRWPPRLHLHGQRSANLRPHGMRLCRWCWCSSWQRDSSARPRAHCKAQCTRAAHERFRAHARLRPGGSFRASRTGRCGCRWCNRGRVCCLVAFGGEAAAGGGRQRQGRPWPMAEMEISPRVAAASAGGIQ